MKPNSINGMSPSRFKTHLKLAGYRVPRDFYARGCVSEYRGRVFRWRWWSDPQEVDISCPKEDFDRWANSTDISLDFSTALAKTETQT